MKKIVKKINNYIHIFLGGGNRRDTAYLKLYKYRKIIKDAHLIRKQMYLIKYEKLMNSFECSIPISTKLGNNIFFPHFSGIFISVDAAIGDNCIIYQQVTIGSNTLNDAGPKGGAPKIGENVYIGAGAKIIGNVTIGNNVRIGANCIVCQNIPDNATVVMNAPRIIEHRTRRDNNFVDLNTWKKKRMEKNENSSFCADKNEQ